MSAPLILAVLSGILFGSWSVALKKARGSNFENFFLIFVIAILSFVSVATLVLEGTGIFGQMAGANLKSLIWGLGGGAFWGLATLSFGYALTLLGLALGYAIILGLAMFLGTSVSMFLMSGLPVGADPAVRIYATLGMLVTLVGIFLSSYAGSMKSKAAHGRGRRRGFAKGIIVCAISGILSGFFAWGYAGAHEQLSTWASILLLTLGFSLAQLVVLVVRITKLANWRAYKDIKSNILYPLLGGLVFGFAVVFHFASADKVGVALAYPLMMGIQILSGNLWSFFVFKEWRGAPKNAMMLQVLALAVLVTASIVVGRAMGLVP